MDGSLRMCGYYCFDIPVTSDYRTSRNPAKAPIHALILCGLHSDSSAFPIQAFNNPLEAKGVFDDVFPTSLAGQKCNHRGGAHGIG